MSNQQRLLVVPLLLVAGGVLFTAAALDHSISSRSNGTSAFALLQHHLGTAQGLAALAEFEAATRSTHEKGNEEATLLQVLQDSIGTALRAIEAFKRPLPMEGSFTDAPYRPQLQQRRQPVQQSPRQRRLSSGPSNANIASYLQSANFLEVSRLASSITVPFHSIVVCTGCSK